MPDYRDRIAKLLSEPSTDAGRDAKRRGRVGRSRDEMLVQGEALANTLAGEAEAVGEIAARLAEKPPRRVVIAGCGDSWFIGMGARLAFEQLLGVPTEAAQAFDFARYHHTTSDDRTLAIGLSSSGTTPAVTEALDAAKSRGALTVGVTNTPDSPLAKNADHTLAVHAVRRGWPTQSSTAAIGLLVDLALRTAEAAGRDADAAPLRRALEALPEQMREVTESADDPMRRLAREWAEARLLLFTGAGPAFAAANFGAAKTKELGPIHAYAIPLEEYHHYRSQKSGDPLFLLAPDAASFGRALDTALVSHEVGGRTVALHSAANAELAAYVPHHLALPDVPPALAAMTYAIPLHLFSYHFAEARFERDLGYPGAFPAATRGA